MAIRYECDDEICEQVLHLLSEGCLPIECAGAFGLPQEVWDNWINPEHDDYKPSFAHAVSVGFVKCQAWWIKQGRIGMNQRNFNHSAWASVMKQAFAWQDKTVIKTEDDGNNDASMSALVGWFRSMSPDERTAAVEYRREQMLAKESGRRVI